ncbi:hypothetical protein PIB30_085422 [Stylosanthes scabra]|uniref:Uncharacterized protein n=1 Tax=Stylosanthes scabra TaxID=79078 RepID=A0ABU6ZS49_9FABA|nr:hypothetical protein [Stylosanthes scabra]
MIKDTLHGILHGFDDAYYGYENHPLLCQPSQGNTEDILQALLQERKEIWESQKRIEAQLATLKELAHECLQEVEEENVDQEVVDEDKESKGMEILHSGSSEATPSKLPSELQFEWVSFSNLNFIGPQHYGLLETDGHLKALCGVLDKKEEDSAELGSEFKAYSGYLHKLHNNRARLRALSSRKHLGPWQFQEKLVDSQNNGWTNQVWDPGKSYKSQHFWGFITCLGVLANLIYMTWNPIKNTKSKHWWRFITSVEALRSLVHATQDTRDQCNNKNW